MHKIHNKISIVDVINYREVHSFVSIYNTGKNGDYRHTHGHKT